jgi:hypothetical protein
VLNRKKNGGQVVDAMRRAKISVDSTKGDSSLEYSLSSDTKASNSQMIFVNDSFASESACDIHSIAVKKHRGIARRYRFYDSILERNLF